MVAKTKIMGQPPLPEAFLVIRSGVRSPKKPQRIGHTTYRIGRDTATNDLILDDEHVSAEHAVIKYENNRFVLYDLASRNRTYLNDKSIEKQALLDGDVIQLGKVKLVFKEVKD
ncbi:MAG: FHA domain-containing protein [Anaerolineae bacterium]|nr:FHA domain-containing protein [Anaerolineae bacterium]